MLSLSIIQEIRTRYFQQDESISKIAADLHLDRKTVRKYVNMTDFSPKPPIRRRATLLDSLEQIICEWLKEEKSTGSEPLTARTIWERLRDQHGFRGSYETVQKKVKELRRQMAPAPELPEKWRQPYMRLELRELQESDVEELAGIMRRAFAEDAKIHCCKEKSGPARYSDGSWLRKRRLQEDSSAYSVCLGGHLMGGVILQTGENGHNRLDCIFLDPLFQNHGYGLSVWNLIEEMYPDTSTWTAESPAFSCRTLNFLVNKCGFRIIRIKNPKSGLKAQYVMEKVVQRV